MTVQHRHPPGKYRLTVEDFMRLDEADVFGADRTELLGGEIIIMNAEYRPHSRVTSELGYRLRRVLEAQGSDLYVMGGSVAISDHDLPLPDIVLTAEPTGEGPIPAASVALVVEVSSSTLNRDLQEKAAIYAAAGIPEYWVVDVAARIVHRSWRPSDRGYAARDGVAFGETLASVTIPGLSVATDRL